MSMIEVIQDVTKWLAWGGGRTGRIDYFGLFI